MNYLYHIMLTKLVQQSKKSNALFYHFSFHSHFFFGGSTFFSGCFVGYYYTGFVSFLTSGYFVGCDDVLPFCWVGAYYVGLPDYWVVAPFYYVCGCVVGLAWVVVLVWVVVLAWVVALVSLASVFFSSGFPVVVVAAGFFDLNLDNNF